MLHDRSSRPACEDYFGARGCDSDVAADAAHAETLLNFRKYDLIVADLPRDGAGCEEAFRLLELARRRNPAQATVLLTSGAVDVEGMHAWLTVLTKPQRLDTILNAGVVAVHGA